jgi:putative membrane-bound dehydrogenase-like protein
MTREAARLIDQQILRAFLETVIVLLFLSGSTSKADVPAADELEASRLAENAVSGLDVAPGLEATLFASEPMLLSPTNIDVDHRGRVWVCEVVNYRLRNGSRPEGDRILILEDIDGDGQADKSSVFYQGRDVDSAMGICVLGNRVIVSASPNVFVFTDTDGDDKADKKELLFTKTGNPQHDHSAHAFVFGPDGKLYWNFGNEGKGVHDKDGDPVVDLSGNVVVDDGKPYREGMVFRCNLDGSDFEVLGNNFRNNYEVSVDAFGTLWQSDNDDDGNRGVRINFVMEYGNYGYRDEKTGAGWRTKRVGMADDIPLQHWHLNDPGVVPNLLQTGAGSPTGILVYEGELLPERFRNQIIHCDAGPNVVRAYSVKPDGAGYKAEMVNILHGARDQWSRPSDVCVAPDGSLIVADWYDPGVGGHRMGDIQKGRIFRVAPPGAPCKTPTFDFASVEGAIEALKSPNLATRYLAWTALHQMQAKAEPALHAMFENDENPRFRARALWLLGNIEGKEQEYVVKAIEDSNADIRITGLRLARRLKLDVVPLLRQLVQDDSPQVRRECAIALRHNTSKKMPALWEKLASRHNGQDRWYLEALGIAADGRWNDCFAAWRDGAGTGWNSPAGRDVIWRSRAARTPEYLTKILSNAETPSAELPRYLRAWDFLDDDNAKQTMLEQLAFHNSDVTTERGLLVAREALLRLSNRQKLTKTEQLRVLNHVLDANRGTEEYLALVQKYQVNDRNGEILALAQAHSDQEIGVQAIQLLVSLGAISDIEQAMSHEEVPSALAIIRAVGNSKVSEALPLLWLVVDETERPIELRREAVRALAGFKNAATKLLSRAESGELAESLRDAVAAAILQAPWPEVKARAILVFPPPPSRNAKPLPPLTELANRRGNLARGRIVFHSVGTCTKCHIVDGLGKEVGPNLSEIGDKLSRQAFFESILFPNAGISHNYETYVVLLESGNVETGIITNRTSESITLKGADAIERKIALSKIEEIRKQDISLMPADLQKTMSEDELIDVVEYLTTLKKENKTAGR